MYRSAVKNALCKWGWAVVAAAIILPGQVSAQVIECEASLAGPDFTGELFFVGDPITIDLQVGAGDVSPAYDDGGQAVPDSDYLDINQFSYALDCDGAGALGCPWAGNDVSLVPGSVSTNCTIDGAPSGTLVTLDATVQDPAPPGTPGTDPSPWILFEPTNGAIRNFNQATCDVSFQIVVNSVTGDNTEKVVNEFTGWTTADAMCANGDSASAALPITFDLSTEVARFVVTKDFTDDNSGSVDVFLQCNGGLPLEQDSTIVDPAGGGDGFDQVTFTVRYITSGEVDCSIWEEPVPDGYSASYTASLGTNGAAGEISPPDSLEGCEYTDILTGEFGCEITNEPAPIDIIVYKEWIGDFVDNGFALEATADYSCYDVLDGADGQPITIQGSLEFTGEGASDTIEGLYANPNGDSYCDVTEVFVHSVVVADDSDCQDVSVEAGATCTIYNTIFFEGIPVLDRSGLALLALLMLGVGLVGFRRLI